MPSLRPFIATAILGLISGVSNAQDFSPWVRLLSYRPDSAVQEKVQNRPADAAGNRWRILKVERARGDLFLQLNSLVIDKMPALGGKVLSFAGLLKHIRTELPNLADTTVSTLKLEDEKDAEVWKSESAPGLILATGPAGAAETNLGLLLAESSASHATLVTTIKGGTSDAAISGNIQLTITPASPLDGCVLQIRAAYRPAAAATTADEQLLADASMAAWAKLLTKVQAFVEANSGTCLPSLGSTSLIRTPWKSVAKAFHRPEEEWSDLDGLWVTTDREKRFRVNFLSDTSCEFIERNREGKELRLTLPLTLNSDPKLGYVIDRPNDQQEVLEFLGFKAELRLAIIDRKPEPSRLTLKKNSKGKLVANWYGLAISRDALGSLQELKQPSKTPPKIFELSPSAE
jgi:hypothetical protein